mgnify:CR=1 FL=1
MISRKETPIVDLTFVNSVDQLGSLKRFFSLGNQFLSVPLISLRGKEELYGVLQVSEPFANQKSLSSPDERKRKRRPFNVKEEQFMQVIGRIISACLDNDAYKEKVRCLKQHHKDFTQASNSFLNSIFKLCYCYEVCELSSNKTHQELLYFIKTKMPPFFKFESIGILFYNKTGGLVFYSRSVLINSSLLFG